MLEEDCEAGLLAGTPFVVRGYGEGTVVEVLNPHPLSLVPTSPGLRSLGEQLQKAANKMLDEIKSDQPEEKNGQAEGDASLQQVELRLLETISDSLDELKAAGGEDGKSEKLLSLAKAYAAVASIRRTEEVELHLG